MIRVFVYGTLMTGEANHGVAAPYVHSVETGAVRGTLFDAGPYPALVADLAEDGRGSSVVHGEWLTVTDSALSAMDALEDYYGPGDARNDYERVWICDIDEARAGWAYVWNDSRGCPQIRSGNWRKRKSNFRT
ncbi:MAG: hypothetical protein K0R28_5971 [Paenibacillus sp.]|jgi:gamma-glutamylcyclotransferase (GGCT)/AIG2-like uncharacterized protein YtfP|nr:hypothetical protein [Paenibacillus sp.]